jgi:type I restriction enzyme M protein
MLLFSLDPGTARFERNQTLSYLFNHKNEDDFYELFDKTLKDIAAANADIFSVNAGGGQKILLFEGISQYVIQTDKKTPFCRAIIDRLAEFSFEAVFSQKYDFFAAIFEYLIKDYNKDFGKYGEYYTPHSIATIIARIMVQNAVKNVTVYDPAAGSGTLVLALAHQIGEKNCTIYTQDISQKSNEFLRLNLILNNLVHSLGNVVHDNTLTNPRHLNREKNDLKKFDYIVSNPPFKTDFSDDREELAAATHAARFFAGVPNVPDRKKEKMAIYLMFLQHIIYSLDEKGAGKAAVVVPTGFLTAQSGIEKKIRQHLADKKMLRGVVSMPSNIFATTGTNVSIVFIDRHNEGAVILMDASKLGSKVKEDGKNQKTVLNDDEIEKIISVFNKKETVEDFSITVSYEDIAKKNYSFSAGQYFPVKIDYVDITPEEFDAKMKQYTDTLDGYFEEGHKLEDEIRKQLAELQFTGKKR